MQPENNTKSLAVIVVVIVIVAVGGYFFYTGSGSTGGGSGGGGGSERIKTPEPTLAPQLQLTPQEKAGDVGDKKAEILKRARSGKLLTPEQKSEIGGIMLTKAHIYNFTEEERVDIFEALQK